MITMSSSYEPTNATADQRGHNGTSQTVAKAVCHVGRERRPTPSPSSPRASAGTGAFRRAKSSITFELA